ncbi:hypothetical protein OH77DRAFT_467629 [Trametes cingulata]|nr:hypothetical protein OH77DRAFT_467629 [Trametes cingulata]
MARSRSRSPPPRATGSRPTDRSQGDEQAAIERPARSITEYIEDHEDEDDLETLLAQIGLSSRLQRLRGRLTLSPVLSPSPSPSPPPTPLPPPPPPPECCTICGDDVPLAQAVRLACGHAFDAACLRELFARASTDESLFPPRCCRGAVPLREVEGHFDRAFVERYERKAREFGTPDRVYCHNAACAAFLGPASPAPSPKPSVPSSDSQTGAGTEAEAEAKTLRCPECAAGTCAACKAQTHPGVPCHFRAEDAVLELGRAHGWQRCPACHHLVELALGCYHIVCRCGTQWCYLCAAPWKECGCALFYVPPEEDE